jgi:hypothetical protein
MAILRGIPARSILRTAERRRSWKSRPSSPAALQALDLSLPKTPAGHTRAPFRSIDACQGQRVNRPSLLHRDMTGIENESRPDGSSPRRAHPMDEKPCFCLRKSVPARRGTTRKVWCHETVKRRAVRIDGASCPPEESQRHDHSQVRPRPSAPGRLSPALNACASSRSNGNSFAESAAATSRSTQ